MKKTIAKKLQLKKGVIAQLNKHNMNQVAGGDDHTFLNCPTIVETICADIVIGHVPTRPCPTIVADICAAINIEVPTRNRICTYPCPR